MKTLSQHRIRNHRPVYQIDCDSGVSCCDFLTSPVPSRYYDLLGMCCFPLSLWLNAHPPKKEFVYVSESQSIWYTGLWSGLVMRPFARSRTFCNSLSASCNWNSQKRIIKSFNDLETMNIYFTLLWASFEPGQKTLSRKFSVFGFLSLAPFYFVSSVVNFHYQKLKSRREAK